MINFEGHVESPKKQICSCGALLINDRCPLPVDGEFHSLKNLVLGEVCLHKSNETKDLMNPLAGISKILDLIDALDINKLKSIMNILEVKDGRLILNLEINISNSK